MTTVLIEILSILFTLVGLAFTIIGAIGVLRMPDVYHRLHAASKCSTLGLVGLLLGLAFHVSLYPGGMPVVIKAVITVIFAFVAMPTGSHILAKAAHKDGAPQWEGVIDDELAKDRD